MSTSQIEVIKCHNQMFSMFSLLKSVNTQKYQIKAYNFFKFLVCSQYFNFCFHYLCEVTVLKSCHGISVKCSRYRDTRPAYPSLAFSDGLKFNLTGFLLVYLYIVTNDNHSVMR